MGVYKRTKKLSGGGCLYSACIVPVYCLYTALSVSLQRYPPNMEVMDFAFSEENSGDGFSCSCALFVEIALKADE